MDNIGGALSKIKSGFDTLASHVISDEDNDSSSWQVMLMLEPMLRVMLNIIETKKRKLELKTGRN